MAALALPKGQRAEVVQLAVESALSYLGQAATLERSTLLRFMATKGQFAPSFPTAEAIGPVAQDVLAVTQEWRFP